MRRFGARKRSIPKGVGGFFADAYFPSVSKIHHAPDDGHNLVEVQRDVRKFQQCSHSAYLFTIHYYLFVEFAARPTLGPGRRASLRSTSSGYGVLRGAPPDANGRAHVG